MTEHTLLLRGLNIHYTVEGKGPDVLLVHGWTASRRMWADLSSQLAGQYRCWALDLPGCGDSDKPGYGWYSIPNFTAILNEFVQTAGIERARVVGHSMGGMIALNLAAMHPGALARLVAINPVVTGRASLRPLAKPDASRRLLDWTLRFSPIVLRPLLSHAYGDRLDRVRHIRRRAEDFAKGTVDSIISSGRAILAYDVSPLLDRIAAPTLVIVGTQDAQVPPSEGRLAAERISGARLSVMRAGHLPTDERPAEILRQLRRFLS